MDSSLYRIYYYFIIYSPFGFHWSIFAALTDDIIAFEKKMKQKKTKCIACFLRLFSIRIDLWYSIKKIRISCGCASVMYTLYCKCKYRQISTREFVESKDIPRTGLTISQSQITKDFFIFFIPCFKHLIIRNLCFSFHISLRFVMH